MYKYQLINGHYVVEIDNKKYVLDTGSKDSFWMKTRRDTILIDGVSYPLASNKLSPVQEMETMRFVGCDLDGFIGLDIIEKTSLTIYKDGNIAFKSTDIDSKKTKFIDNNDEYLIVESNQGRFLIDTGAKYGYCVKSILSCEIPLSRVHDYNPILGHLYSDLYLKRISIADVGNDMYVCNNADVQRYYLPAVNCKAIGNITGFFKEVCVFDLSKGELILK